MITGSVNIHETSTILDPKAGDSRAEAVCGSCASDGAGAAADGGCDHRAHCDKGQGLMKRRPKPTRRQKRPSRHRQHRAEVAVLIEAVIGADTTTTPISSTKFHRCRLTVTSTLRLRVWLWCRPKGSSCKDLSNSTARTATLCSNSPVISWTREEVCSCSSLGELRCATGAVRWATTTRIMFASPEPERPTCSFRPADKGSPLQEVDGSWRYRGLALLAATDNL